jgi:hypothetical protein
MEAQLVKHPSAHKDAPQDRQKFADPFVFTEIDRVHEGGRTNVARGAESAY